MFHLDRLAFVLIGLLVGALGLPNPTLAQTPTTLQVTSFQPTFSGFEAQFNRALDTSLLNLYGTETGGFGPPDVTLVGAVVGNVRGTLVFDSTSHIVFVKTAAPLEPDTYTVTLRSAINGFKDLDGQLLDGNGDGVAGDDFVRSFVIQPPAGAIASIPDFTYGPGQAVNVPFDRVGLPITLSNGTGVNRVEFSLLYNPSLLRINAVARGDDLPPDGVITVDAPQPGVLNVVVVTKLGFAPLAVEVVRLAAEVPVDAPYRAAQSLYFTTLSLNQGALPVVPDDGVHVIAYLGDTTGNAAYSALDGQRILRVVVGVDTGFAAYPTIDPVLIADITDNNALSALDATRVLQEAVGLAPVGIAHHPTIATLTTTNGTVGTTVVISGRSFVPGKTTVTFGGVPATIINMTADTIETFVPIGAASGQIRVDTDSGFATNNFAVTLTQDFALSISPSAGSIIQGSSTSFALKLNSTGQQPFTGLAGLSIVGLPSGVTASFSAPALTGGQQGLLTLTASSNATLTNNAQLTISANASVDALTISKQSPFQLTVLQGNRTALQGQFMLVDGTPMPNVSLTLKSLVTHTPIGSAITDAGGNFIMLDPPPGDPHVLTVDMTQFDPTKPYPMYGMNVTVVGGQVNVIGPFKQKVPPPNSAYTQINNALQAQVITNPELPGVSITLPAGAIITEWVTGNLKTQIAIEKYLPDELPVPPPPFLTNSLYHFHFGTAMGGIPSQPLPVTLPNDQGAEPGEKVEIWYYDAAPIPGQPGIWTKAGMGTVSADGTVIVADPGVGIQRFCGICGLTCIKRLIGGLFSRIVDALTGGDPVDLVLGQQIETKTDLVLPGRLPAVVQRTYNPADPFAIKGFTLGLGPSWALSVDIVLLETSAALRTIILPGNARYDFAQLGPGTFANTTAPQFTGALLTIEAGNVHKLRFRDGSIWRFVPHPNSLLAGIYVLSQQVDRNGNTLTVQRDANGNITQLIEPSGRSLNFTYSGGRISQISDPLGRTVTYTYSGGRLASATNPAKGTTSYTYNAAGGMVSITDARNITYLTNQYNAEGRVVRQTMADGGFYTFEYIRPAGSTVGAVTGAKVTDPRGNTTTYNFDSNGRGRAIVNALGQATNMIRDSRGLVTSVIDSINRETKFEYDGVGNITKITDPAGNIRLFQYEPTFNKLTKVTDPLGHFSTFGYDNKGNLITVTDPLGNTTQIAYNIFGQPVSVTDALKNTTGFAYDTNGNLITVSDPLGNTTQRTYDIISRLNAQTDPRGRVTGFEYDALSRIKEITDAIGGLTSFTYDGNSNLLTVTDARGNTLGHSYDSMDRLVTRTDQLGKPDVYNYDLNGNLIQMTDRKGQVSGYQYDALDRRIGGIYADGSFNQFQFDSAGRMVRAKDSLGGELLFGYDNLDRRVFSNAELGTIQYGFDAAGRRTSMTVSGQATVNYSYDANSRLRQVTRGTSIVNLDYDALNRRTKLTLPNAVLTEYTYDAASRLTEQIYKNATNTLGNLTYQYDAIGNRRGTGGSFAQSMLPDPIASANYDVANRQLQFGNNTMTYDLTGNLATMTNPSGLTTFSWDARHRLAGMSGPGTTAAFSYDPVSRRRSKQINGQLAQFNYDGLTQVAEKGISSTNTSLNSLGIDEPWQRNNNEFYLADVMGTVVGLTDATGNVNTRYGYEPFGKTVTQQGTSLNSIQFTGREKDGTDFYYFRARYYNTTLHRFISEDPIGMQAGDTNFYAYVGNQPTRLVDPFGFEGLDYKLWKFTFDEPFGGPNSFVANGFASEWWSPLSLPFELEEALSTFNSNCLASQAF